MARDVAQGGTWSRGRPRAGRGPGVGLDRVGPRRPRRGPGVGLVGVGLVG